MLAQYVTTKLSKHKTTHVRLLTYKVRFYEAYSESKYRFAVKKKASKVSYKILLLSDSTFFKLFFHIFAAITGALVAGHKFSYTLLIECGRLRC